MERLSQGRSIRLLRASPWLEAWPVSLWRGHLGLWGCWRCRSPSLGPGGSGHSPGRGGPALCRRSALEAALISSPGCQFDSSTQTESNQGGKWLYSQGAGRIRKHYRQEPGASLWKWILRALIKVGWNIRSDTLEFTDLGCFIGYGV